MAVPGLNLRMDRAVQPFNGNEIHIPGREPVGKKLLMEPPKTTRFVAGSLEITYIGRGKLNPSPYRCTTV